MTPEERAVFAAMDDAECLDDDGSSDDVFFDSLLHGNTSSSSGSSSSSRTARRWLKRIFIHVVPQRNAISGDAR